VFFAVQYSLGLMNRNLKRQIEEGAEELRRLQARVKETVKCRDQSPKHREEWSNASAEFRLSYSELAFPGGLLGAWDRMLAGDKTTIETALCWLECRPYFFRSGYMYKDMLRKLKRAPMGVAHSRRLADVVEAYESYRRKRRRT